MDKARILIIDDDERICRLVKRYVEKDGFDLVFANTTEEARTRLNDDTIELILLDVMLPDTDGFTLAQEIRTSSTIPIIFLTAKAEIRTITVGVFSCISCRAVNCAAPAMTTMEKAIVSNTLSPASVASTPNRVANGIITRMNGLLSMIP